MPEEKRARSCSPSSPRKAAKSTSKPSSPHKKRKSGNDSRYTCRATSATKEWPPHHYVSSIDNVSSRVKVEPNELNVERRKGKRLIITANGNGRSSSTSSGKPKAKLLPVVMPSPKKRAGTAASTRSGNGLPTGSPNSKPSTQRSAKRAKTTPKQNCSKKGEFRTSTPGSSDGKKTKRRKSTTNLAKMHEGSTCWARWHASGRHGLGHWFTATVTSGSISSGLWTVRGFDDEVWEVSSKNIRMIV